MSLEDKFYPPERDFITGLDNNLIKMAGKLVQGYQQVFDESHESIVKQGYLLSGIVIAATAATLNPYLVPMLLPIYQSHKNPQIESPIEEEIRYESLGRNRNLEKYIRLAHVGVATFTQALAVYFLLDQPGLDGIDYSLAGSAWGMFCIANYAAKAYIPPPPPKTIPQKVKDRLTELAQETRPEIKPA